MSMIDSKSRGFTLIELMMVIGIIGLLTRLALPHFEDSIEKARLTEVVLEIDAIRVAANTALQSGDRRLLTVTPAVSLIAPLTSRAMQFGFNGGFSYPGLRFSALSSSAPVGHFPGGVARVDMMIAPNGVEARQSIKRLSEILPEESQAWAVPGVILLVNLAMDN